MGQSSLALITYHAQLYKQFKPFERYLFALIVWHTNRGKRVIHESIICSKEKAHISLICLVNVDLSRLRWRDFDQPMGNLHHRLNFDPGKTNKIFHHSSKEHVKISRIAKFGCDFSGKIDTKMIGFRVRNTFICKFANFARLYFPHFTTCISPQKTWLFY